MRYRRSYCAVLAGVALAWAQSAMGGGFGVGVRTGMLMPLAGSYKAGVSSVDLLQHGVSHGVLLRQQISTHYGIEAGVDLGWAAFAQPYREEPGKTPHFVLPAATFCSLLRVPVGPLAPYAGAGVGIFPWRFTRDALTGDPVTVEGEALQKMSAGVVGEAGVELKLTGWAAIFAEARVVYLLSRDRFLFGEHFSEQTLLIASGGVMFSPWSGKR